jgi:hypothetical protein
MVVVMTTVLTVVGFGVAGVVTGVVFTGVALAPGTVCPCERFDAMINPAMNARITITISTIARLPGSLDAGGGDGRGGGDSGTTGAGSGGGAKGESVFCSIGHITVVAGSA